MEARTPMTRQVIVIPPELPVDRAWALLRAHRIRHLPVVSGGKLMGIVSDRDLRLHATLEGDEPTFPGKIAAEVMTAALVTCQPETSVSDVVRRMTERKVDAIPVVDLEERLIGLVTTTDLLLLLIDWDEAKLPFDWELLDHSLASAAYA